MFVAMPPRMTVWMPRVGNSSLAESGGGVAGQEALGRGRDVTRNAENARSTQAFANCPFHGVVTAYGYRWQETREDAGLLLLRRAIMADIDTQICFEVT